MVADQTMIENARGKWKDELKNVWGGTGSFVDTAAKTMQEAALGTAVIPVVGELAVGIEIPVYAASTFMRAAVRNSAETKAVVNAGGTEKDYEGRFGGHLLKSAVPVFDI